MNDWWCPHCGMKFRSAIAEARHRHNFPLLCKRKKGKNAPILDRDTGHDDEPTQEAEAKEAPPEPGMGEDRAAGQPALADVSEAPMVPERPMAGWYGDWVRRGKKDQSA